MTRAEGMFISHHQETLENVGNTDYIWQKVSEGVWKDPLYDEFLPVVRTWERRGGVHYFRTGVNPVTQAEFFYNAQAGQGFKMLALDYEKYYNTLNAQAEVDLRVMWNRLHELTDKPIFLYVGIYNLRDYLIRYDSFWKTVPLWLGRFQGTSSGQPPNNPNLEISGELIVNDWGFWQWEAGGNGKGAEYGVGSDDISLDVFNGTVEELDEFLDITEPVEPVDCCEELEIKLNNLTIIQHDQSNEITELTRRIDELEQAQGHLLTNSQDAFRIVDGQIKELEAKVKELDKKTTGHNHWWHRIR